MQVITPTPAYIIGTILGFLLNLALGYSVDAALFGWVFSMIIGGILFSTGILKA